ncbi:MAG TPA: hypothetical protein VIR58_07685 [Acidimicrobiales bacterium]
MTTWTEYLDELEKILDDAEACIATVDVEGTTTAIAALAEPGFGRELPDLTIEHATRSREAGERLAAVEGWVRGVMARLRPELALVGSMVDSTPTVPLYLDQSA